VVSDDAKTNVVVEILSVGDSSEFSSAIEHGPNLVNLIEVLNALF
jgi:uncharacterized pyridoxal phosphate-containing UPF0001 family protein